MTHLWRTTILLKNVFNLKGEFVRSISRKQESPRIKEFHEKLKLEKFPGIRPKPQFFESGRINSETHLNNKSQREIDDNPTKWGEWSHHGRVSDF